MATEPSTALRSFSRFVTRIQPQSQMLGLEVLGPGEVGAFEGFWGLHGAWEARRSTLPGLRFGGLEFKKFESPQL